MKKHSLRIWTGWLAMASHLFRLVNPSSSWECSACTHLTHSRYSSLDNCRKEVNWLKTFYMRSLGFGNWLSALGSTPFSYGSFLSQVWLTFSHNHSAAKYWKCFVEDCDMWWHFICGVANYGRRDHERSWKSMTNIKHSVVDYIRYCYCMILWCVILFRWCCSFPLQCNKATWSSHIFSVDAHPIWGRARAGQS